MNSVLIDPGFIGAGASTVDDKVRCYDTAQHGDGTHFTQSVCLGLKTSGMLVRAIDHPEFNLSWNRTPPQGGVWALHDPAMGASLTASAHTTLCRRPRRLGLQSSSEKPLKHSPTASFSRLDVGYAKRDGCIEYVTFLPAKHQSFHMASCEPSHLSVSNRRTNPSQAPTLRGPVATSAG